MTNLGTDWLQFSSSTMIFHVLLITRTCGGLNGICDSSTATWGWGWVLPVAVCRMLIFRMISSVVYWRSDDVSCPTAAQLKVADRYLNWGLPNGLKLIQVMRKFNSWRVRPSQGQGSRRGPARLLPTKTFAEYNSWPPTDEKTSSWLPAVLSICTSPISSEGSRTMWKLWSVTQRKTSSLNVLLGGMAGGTEDIT